MVPSPDTPLRVTRGSTTQNFASSPRRLATRFDIFAITAARIGMIQTMEMRELFFETTVACATSSRSPSAMISLPGRAGIPDETGVERHRRQLGQDDHRGEEDHARTGLHGHERLQLRERHREGVDEHVEHRPATDD